MSVFFFFEIDIYVQIGAYSGSFPLRVNKNQSQFFLIEIYKAVRAATSENFIISVKLNSADFQRGGITEEDVIAVFKAIDAAGIDIISPQRESRLSMIVWS